jgi:hypothetical protein
MEKIIQHLLMYLWNQLDTEKTFNSGTKKSGKYSLLWIYQINIHFPRFLINITLLGISEKNMNISGYIKKTFPNRKYLSEKINIRPQSANLLSVWFTLFYCESTCASICFRLTYGNFISLWYLGLILLTVQLLYHSSYSDNLLRQSYFISQTHWVYGCMWLVFLA